MAERDDLDTILQLIDRIEETVSRQTAASFPTAHDALDAVTYRLSQIGEHCRRLPADYHERHPDVPWRAMVGLRNTVSHGYDNVSPAIVGETATEHLDPIRDMAEAERLRLKREIERGHGW